MEDNNTETQDQQENKTPEAVQDAANASVATATKPKMSKKKLLLMVAPIIALLGAGATYAFVLNKDEPVAQQSSSESQNNQTEEAEAYVSPYVLVAEENVSYFDEEGKLQDLTTIDKEDQLLGARNENGEIVVYYAKSKTATSESYGEYQKVDTIHRSAKSGDKVVATLADDVGSPYTTMLLSPNGKKTIIEKVGFLGTGSGMGDLVEVNLEDGSTKTVYEPSDDELFVVVGWLDDTTALLQEQTCRECDGPRKPVLHKLDTTTKKLTGFFNVDDTIDTLGYGGFFQSSDLKRLFVMGSDYSKVFMSEPDATSGSTYFYEIDLETGKEKEIVSFPDDSVNYAGLSDDGSKLFISKSNWEKTDDPNASYQSSDKGNYDLGTPDIIEVSTADGSQKKLSIESKFLKNGTNVGVYLKNNGYYLYAATPVREGSNYTGTEHAIVDVDSTNPSELALTTLLERTISSNDRGYVTLLSVK